MKKMLLTDEKFNIIVAEENPHKKPKFMIKLDYNEARVKNVEITKLDSEDIKIIPISQIALACKKSDTTLNFMLATFNGELEKVSSEVFVASWLKTFTKNKTA